MNKLLTTLFAISLFFNAQAQDSDTVSCVSGPNTLEYAVHYNHQSCPDSCNGSALIEILQGSGNYQYSWTSTLGYSAAHPNPDSLCPDDYLLVVQDMNFGIFCTMQITIDSLQPFTHSINTTNVSATGACDGTAELILNGGIQPYIVSWYDANQNLISNEDSTFLDSLCAGNYYYQVGWNSNCGPADTIGGIGNGTGGLVPFSINEPLIVNLDFYFDETCFAWCDGMAEFSATGGSGNYTFDIGFGAQSTGTFSGLCSGSYTVSVTDDFGGSGTATVFIMDGQMIQGTTSSTDVSCNGSCDGTITVYDASWDMNLIQVDVYDAGNNNLINSMPTSSGSSNFTGLCAGTYDIFGTSINGCYDLIGAVVINEPSLITLSLNPTDESGSGQCDGNISYTTNGGVAPYIFDLYDCSGNHLTSQTGLDFTGLCGGCYDVCVTDANGCQTCNQVSIATGCNMSATSTQMDATCNGTCDGSATVTVTGGDGNYSYSWDDPANQTTATASGLCAGIYICTILDGQGCSFSQTVLITEPQELITTTNVVIDSTDFNSCEGLINSNVTGGNGSYTYNWIDCDNNTSISTSDSAANLCPGEYSLTVTDLNGCSYTTPCNTIYDKSVNYLGEFNQMEIAVYPNPVIDQINISCNKESFQIRLYDLNGKLIFSAEVNERTHVIDIDKLGLSKGMYHLQIFSEGQTGTQKIVVR